MDNPWDAFDNDSGNSNLDECIGYIGYLSGIKDLEQLKTAHRQRFEAIINILTRDFNSNPPTQQSIKE